MHTGHRPCEGTEGGHLQAEEAASEETKPADTLILDFQPLELWGNTFLLFKPLSL